MNIFLQVEKIFFYFFYIIILFSFKTKMKKKIKKVIWNYSFCCLSSLQDIN